MVDYVFSPYTLSPKVAGRIQVEEDESASDSGLLIRQKYLSTVLKREGAIAAVDRIMQYGCNEEGLKLRDYPYFRDQLRLTADMRLKSVLTTGCSQVSKTLGNVNVLADCLVFGQMNCGYFFDSRDNLYNNQPMQIQPVLDNYVAIARQGLEVRRSMTARFSYGIANGYFFYVTGDSKESSGGAAESSKVASVSISAAWLEEYSSWGNVDITPRLQAGAILSKPQRKLGTPGGGSSKVDKDLASADHVFFPSVVCPHCGHTTYLDVKGSLLKPKRIEKLGVDKFFNARGELHDFWSHDGSPESAFVACLHCHKPIAPELIRGARLRDRLTGQLADDFLDSLSEDEVYGGDVAIVLSPLLRVPDDPMRLQDLVREGLEPENPLIYMQNKLGIVSEIGVFGISLQDLNAALSSKKRSISPSVRVAGLDQGRDTHYLTIIDFNPDNPSEVNIVLADTCGQEEILTVLNYHNVSLMLIDNEPDRLAARDISLSSGSFGRTHPITKLLQELYKDRDQLGYRVMLADQKGFETDIKPNKVMHGSVAMPCLDVNTSLFIDKLVAGFTDRTIQISGKVHRKFQKHVTSVKRDLDSGRWVRPRDHDDDFFFSLMFCFAARDFWMKAHHKNKPSIAVPVGKKFTIPNSLRR